MNNYKIISDNIAWDGSYFCCRRCGKAGYKSMAAVKGHLGMCKGKAMQKGAIQLTGASYSSVGTTLINDLGNNPVELATATARASNQLATNGIDGADIQRRLTTLENEYVHVLAENNPVATESWISRNKELLIVLVCLFIVYLIWRESQCKCDSGTKRTGMGLTLTNKVAGKAIDLGLNKLFK